MTAFGRSTLPVEGGELLCEIRSVNHRFLDIGIRLPDSIRNTESMFRTQLSQTLQRGKVEAVLRFNEGVGSASAIRVDEALLEQLLSVASKVESMTAAVCVIDSVQLLRWPGLVSVGLSESQIDMDEAQRAFDLALQDFVATREREGEQMASVLRNKNNQLIAQLEQLRHLRPSVLQRQREKLQVKLASLAEEHNESRLEQELVYAAQRLDIDEELDRLGAHAQELRLALQRDDPVGRRLDFLMQEFNREVNTICSKSQDQQTTAIAVDMKVLIEQMREQIQNIE